MCICISNFGKFKDFTEQSQSFTNIQAKTYHKLVTCTKYFLTFTLIKLQAETWHFTKKEALAQVFFCEFCEILKNTFFTEHLWTTASVWVLRDTPVYLLSVNDALR